MSTIKANNFQHPSATNPAIVLDASGNAIYAGTHNFIAATVTGAGGLRLITPTSIANSGGSASASGGEVTFTGVSSISLNGVFTSTYDNYIFIMTATNSAGDEINMRLRVAGADASGTNYVFQRLVAGAGSVTSDRFTGQTVARIGFMPTTSNAYSVNVYGPAIAAPTMMRSVNAISQSDATFQDVVARHSLSTAYDGFTLIPPGGNITGKIRVYGYQNS